MIKICAECNKEFECYDHKISGRRANMKRPHKSITCSHKCSVIYNRRKQLKNGK